VAIARLVSLNEPTEKQMNRAELINIIVDRVNEQLSALPDAPAAEAVNEETVLFGETGLLDSLGLVSVVLDVEASINDRMSSDIVIADDRAVSQKHSPFRTAGRLADYVLKLIDERK
jgi:D-alanine--poly(phosphoribitol) ligase subunit 2